MGHNKRPERRKLKEAVERRNCTGHKSWPEKYCVVRRRTKIELN
jgi:hypothetical protein